MKQIAFFLLLSALALHGQDAPESLLEPCDFSKGPCGWHGDVSTSNSTTTSNPLADQSGPVTLDIALSPNHWTKAYQDFNTKYPTLKVTITYQLSTDVTFSDKTDDYVNVTHALDFNGLNPINVEKNNWVILLTDFSAGRFWDYPVAWTQGGGQPHNMVMKLDNIDTSGEHKTLSLGFPPGTGTVSIINAVATP